MEQIYKPIVKFSLHPWQREAFERAFKALSQGKHVLLIAPTGSGKSYVAYAWIYELLKRNQKVAYSVPFRILAYQKASEIRKNIANVPVFFETGELKSYRKASHPIVVATQEITYGKYADRYAIIDEFHTIFTHWTRALVYLKHLEQSKYPVLLMTGTIEPDPGFITHLEKIAGRPVEILDYRYLEHRNQVTVHDDILYVIDIMRITERSQYLTAIVTFSKANVNRIAETLCKFLDDLTEEQLARILEVAHKYYTIENVDRLEEIPGLRYIKKGIAYVHSGIKGTAKRLIIELAEKQLIKVLIGTDAFTTGTNFPIQNIIFANMMKFDGKEFRFLKPDEFLQIIGRAGRTINGIQIEGHVYLLKTFLNRTEQLALDWSKYIRIAQEGTVQKPEIHIEYTEQDILAYILDNYGKHSDDIAELIIDQYKQVAQKYAYPEIAEDEIEQTSKLILTATKQIHAFVTEYDPQLVKAIYEILPAEVFDSIGVYRQGAMPPKFAPVLQQIIETGWINRPNVLTEDETTALTLAVRINLNILHNTRVQQLLQEHLGDPIYTDKLISVTEALIEELSHKDYKLAEHYRKLIERIKSRTKEQVHS